MDNSTIDSQQNPSREGLYTIGLTTNMTFLFGSLGFLRAQHCQEGLLLSSGPYLHGEMSNKSSFLSNKCFLIAPVINAWLGLGYTVKRNQD